MAGTAAKRSRRARRRPEDDVRVDEPGALRALAHPARLIAVDELYQGLERTASELAELAGLTPSAMSYHLRALERWGILERAEASGDGRERPWRAPARSLKIESESTAAGRVASQTIIRTSMDRLLQQFEDLADDDPWDDVSQLSRSRVWLTHDE